jgi:exosortase/archaeosortase family protein
MMKFWGLLAGSIVIHAINIVRFISLFYIGQYSASWFDFAHSYLWESLLILDTMVVFWVWVNHVLRCYAAEKPTIDSGRASFCAGRHC